ncbi:ImmA/IrrE family metallo-endopeptidase [Serratia proteamaculans]|uniref:ImmA/IrrE family metallo-endopeptidase n=1 Tax=Serratia proteamaculans TaxID=28151 RepID=A0ABS0TZ52_SERPR|nr:ImmA/IrrE family metallo-endopeptidase [Serratia proteamaculans]MBI6183645.1 ImmA/IrrE family metallo-endopeptidase [Serratia proteamaculans]
MKDDIEDLDFSFGKYSSTSMHEEYENFVTFNAYIESLPVEVKRAKGIIGRKKNFNNISDLFSSFCQKTEKSHALFRRGSSSDDVLVNTWLSFVYEKEKIVSAIANVPTYSPISREFLVDFVKNSVDEAFPLLAPKALMALGIILIYEEAIPSAKVDGVVYINDNGNPVIAMSLRYSRIDNYWFTLMHELSHVLLHYENLGSPIIDNMDVIAEPENLIESQADRMALDTLIPRGLWRGCSAKQTLREDDLFAFSKEIGIHPAIVAGRIRNEKRSYKFFSRIVNAVNLREVIFNV